MVCGDKYRYLIRTVGGNTADEPCGEVLGQTFCGPFDVADWLESAHKLSAIVVRKWAELRKLENEKGAKLPESDRNQASDELSPMVGQFQREVIDLPTMWGVLAEPPGDMIPITNHIVASMEMGTCALERIAQAFDRLGAPMPDPPGVRDPQKPMQPPTLWDTIQTVAVVGLVGLAGWGIIRFVMSRRAASAAALVEVSP